MPSKVNFLLKQPIAHRGLHNDKIPENSMAAFRAAIEKNLPIELDLHLTKSGELVVFHDNSLRRMCGVKKDISKCTHEELKTYRLKDTKEHIPLFSEVLELVNGQVPLLIEIKFDPPAGKPEAAVIEVLKGYHGKYAIQSFDPFSLVYLRRHAPNIPRGQLSSGYRRSKLFVPFRRILKNCRLNFIAKPDFISYETQALPRRRIEKLRSRNIPVLAWTVKNQAELERVQPYCDNTICENIL